MYIIINDEMYNTKKLGSVEINSLNPVEIRYNFKDGRTLMEDLKTTANVTTKMNKIISDAGFIKTTGGTIINPKHIVDIKQNMASPEKLVYVLAGSKPIQEVYENADKVLKKVEEKIKALNPIDVDIDEDDDKPTTKPSEPVTPPTKPSNPTVTTGTTTGGGKDDGDTEHIGTGVVPEF